MNWVAIAAIGQIVGSVAVVVSLVFVLVELRQNTEVMRTLASQERVQRDFDISESMIVHRDVAELWTRGRQNFQSLDEVDQIRLIYFERRAIVHWSNMFRLKQRRQLPDSSWDELVWLIRSFGTNQGLVATWNIFRESFERDFRDFLDEQFKAAALRAMGTGS